MHLLASVESRIDCPPARVFALISDMERFADWFPEVLEITGADQLPPATVGKRYLERVRVPLRGERRIEISVKEVEADRRFVTEGRFPPLLPRMEVQLQAEAGGTRLCWRMYSRGRGWPLRLLLLLARRTLQRRAERGLERLKELLEG